jgi:hypothetical protein
MKQNRTEPPPRPADPEEAKQWLSALVSHLSNFPHASRRLRFIAYAINEFLSGRETLSKALGLTIKKKSKRCRPTTPPEKVASVLSMLRKISKRKKRDCKVGEATVSSIAKATGVSKSTVETIRAAKNKVFPNIPRSDRTEDRDVRKARWEEALERAETVSTELRSAIIAESAASIDLSGWREETDSQDLPTEQPANRKRKPTPLRRKSK